MASLTDDEAFFTVSAKLASKIRKLASSILAAPDRQMVHVSPSFIHVLPFAIRINVSQ